MEPATQGQTGVAGETGPGAEGAATAPATPAAPPPEQPGSTSAAAPPPAPALESKADEEQGQAQSGRWPEGWGEGLEDEGDSELMTVAYVQRMLCEDGVGLPVRQYKNRDSRLGALGFRVRELGFNAVNKKLHLIVPPGQKFGDDKEYTLSEYNTVLYYGVQTRNIYGGLKKRGRKEVFSKEDRCFSLVLQMPNHHVEHLDFEVIPVQTDRNNQPRKLENYRHPWQWVSSATRKQECDIAQFHAKTVAALLAQACPETISVREAVDRSI